MCKVNQTEESITPVQETSTESKIEAFWHFPTLIYSVKAPQFLPAAKKVVTEAIAEKKKEITKLNEIYPLIMTKNLNSDARMFDLAKFIAQSAWDILDSQGYAMQNLSTYFTEFWCQEHHKHSAMEQHVHGYGSQLVGFYFIDVPENSSRVVFHDPKAGKVQLNLPEKDMSQATPASNMINFVPEAGTVMFANAWLAHSFTRHAASKPMRFIHHQPGIMPACHFDEARQIGDIAIHRIMAFNYHQRPSCAAPRLGQCFFRRAVIIMREGDAFGSGKPGTFQAGIVNGPIMHNKIARFH